MAVLDLNADLGEGMGDDAAMLRIVTSANVACGFHAGDADTMRTTLARAAEHGVTVGAHPSYRDWEGFGRRPMDPPADVLRADLEAQLAALLEAGGRAAIRYLKPHGALYNRIVDDETQAEVVVRVAADAGLPILGLAGSAVERLADRRGVRFVREAFADRGYLPDGRLAPRGTPGALLHDPDVIAARVVRFATDGVVEAVDGTTVPVRAESVCVHGDTDGAVAIARAVRDGLASAGIALGAFA